MIEGENRVAVVLMDERWITSIVLFHQRAFPCLVSPAGSTPPSRPSPLALKEGLWVDHSPDHRSILGGQGVGAKSKVLSSLRP